ncbi:MAG: Fur family transcriptional regulator [Antricoccus sp.]
MTRSNIDTLRDRGLRITAPRIAVLETLIQHPHSTADQVFREVSARLGTVSKQAVYDVLAICVDSGLVRRIRPAGLPALFETRIDDNHHHLVCRACGLTTDVDCISDERPCLTPDDTAGYALDEAEILFWGLCPSCQLQPQSAITT